MGFKKINKEEFNRLLNLGEDKVVSCLKSTTNEAVWIGRNSGVVFGRVLMNSQNFNEFEHEIFES